MNPKGRIGATVALALVLAFAETACAQANLSSPVLTDRVLAVYNDRVAASKEVADYYVAKRGIPPQNLCPIHPGWFFSKGEETVSWDSYDSDVRKPIRDCLDKIGKEKILYIVLTYGTPYKMTGAPTGAGIAVDSFLADIWDAVGGKNQQLLNPYYIRTESKKRGYPAFVSLAEYRNAGNHPLLYSVWRLDGASSQLAKAQVDKALEAERNGAVGQACIDRRYGSSLDNMPDEGPYKGDWDLKRAAEFFRKIGVPVVEDLNEAEFGTAPAPLRCDRAIFYAGWYSLDHYNDAFTWMPGAIGIHLDSASAADPRGGSNWSANAVQKGITITSGAVEEPMLATMAHPDAVISDLLSGANVGDAFFRNESRLKWMILNIGDPLYRPVFRSPK